MRTRIQFAFFALVLMAQMSLVAPALAMDFVECASGIATKDFVAKKFFQTKLRDMVVGPRPDLKELANLNMELQIALAEARKTIIVYLVEHDPARLSTTGGLSRFSNFEWSDEDQEKFVQANEAHAQLEERVEKLRKANDSHPLWGKMRGFMNRELSKNPEFEKLMTQFMADQARVNDMLLKCPSK